MITQPSERAILAAAANPGTVNSTPALTSALDMSLFHEAMFILLLGDMASETIDFKLQESATSGGTYTDISGKAATQLAASASANDNKQIIINLKSSDLSAGMRFVKGRAVTGNTTGGPSCMVGIGLKPRIGPASDDKLSSVVQIVT